MIFDKIENAALYENINPRIKKALEYLRNTDFDKIENGKHVVEGDELIAIFQEYETKNDSDSKLEAHRKYIDVQYVILGEEYIGVKPLINQIPCKEYDIENDYALYDDACSFVKINEQQFAILFPEDLHKPGIKVDSPIKVRKVVMKVKI